MSNPFPKLPSAMAIQRGLVLSDALFFNQDAQGRRTPVVVVEHGVRGTQNVNTDKGAEKDIANPQRTETAKLSEDAEILVVRFDLRAAPLSHAVSMCAEPGGGQKGRELGVGVRQALGEFIERSQGEPLRQLALRYARNVLNGRWLWRNRSYAKAITIKVLVMKQEGSEVLTTQDALKVPVGHFDNPSEAEKAVAEILAQGWEGVGDTPALRIEATVDFGVRGAVEVFPSQNYTTRERGFARSLYKLPLREEQELGSGFKVCGHAALRDQKVGNALRTIDTWYAGFKETRLVTPVEPMAANLDAGVFLRGPSETAFVLLKSIALTDPTTDVGQFLLAILIRGGVFGEKSEKADSGTKKGKGKKGTETEEAQGE